MCNSQGECLFTCHCTRVWQGNRDAQSENEKKLFMLFNNKFLGKCSYGRHLWIRLGMDCGKMVEEGINFILCLGTAYDLSSMESIGNSRSFQLQEKHASQNNFISQFKLWALAPLQISSSLCEGPIYLLLGNFYVKFESSPSLISTNWRALLAYLCIGCS